MSAMSWTIWRRDVMSMRQELEKIWRDEHEAVYELTSLFIHHGAMPQCSGVLTHHLPENPDSWFKYKNSEVSAVSKDGVLANTSGSTANAYMA